MAKSSAFQPDFIAFLDSKGINIDNLNSRQINEYHDQFIEEEKNYVNTTMELITKAEGYLAQAKEIIKG